MAVLARRSAAYGSRACDPGMFDPIKSIPWTYAFWAGDGTRTPLSGGTWYPWNQPSGGISWNSEGFILTNGSNPTWTANDPVVNNRASITWSANSKSHLAINSTNALTTMTLSKLSIVIIGYLPAPAHWKPQDGGVVNANTGNRGFFSTNFGSSGFTIPYQSRLGQLGAGFNSGNAMTGTYNSQAPHIYRINAISSTPPNTLYGLWMDEIQMIFGANSHFGASGITAASSNIAINCDGSQVSPYSSTFCFLGLYYARNGDSSGSNNVSTLPRWNEWVRWAQSYYGIPSGRNYS